MIFFGGEISPLFGSANGDRTRTLRLERANCTVALVDWRR